MRGRNLGMSKAMALDTLGNAYLYLREAYSDATWQSEQGTACLDAAIIIDNCFSMVKAQFELIDFTQRS